MVDTLKGCNVMSRIREFIVNRKIRSERGLYLVIGTALAALFVLLAGLVIGIGIFASSQARAQRVGNLAALGALEAFVQTDGSYQVRADKAKDRANEILAANSLPNLAAWGQIVHENQSGSSGNIILGDWVVKKPTSSDPCNGQYPCFEPNDEPNAELPDSQANAIQISMANSGWSSYLPDFLKLSSEQKIEVTALATIVDRCASFILDVSPSTYNDTHRVPIKGGNYIRWSKTIAADLTNYNQLPYNHPCKCPSRNSLDCPGPLDPPSSQWLGWCALDKDAYEANSSPNPVDTSKWTHANVSLPFFRYGKTQLVTEGGALNCTDPLTMTTEEELIWCNLLPKRPQTGIVDPTLHYQDDYVGPITVGNGASAYQIRVDKFVDSQTGVTPALYAGPEPFTTFLLSYNAGLRLLDQQRTGRDRAILVSTAGDIIGRFPTSVSGAPLAALSSNLTMMIQLTNFENRGTVTWDFPPSDGNPDQRDPMIRPNSFDMAFYSLYTEGAGAAQNNTNLLLAINDSINVLNQYCNSTSAQKTIFIATDGLGTCSSNGSLASASFGDYDCTADFAHYSAAEAQLLNNSDTNSIVSRARTNNIRIVPIVSGLSSGNHFMNVEREGKLLSMEEAFAYGHGRPTPSPGKQALFDFRSYQVNPGSDTIPSGVVDSAAFASIGNPNIKFPRAMASLASVSLMTGAKPCLLMPVCDQNAPIQFTPNCSGAACEEIPGDCPTCCYARNPDKPDAPCELKDQFRNYPGVANYPIQECSLTFQTPSEQAAYCVVQALSGNPFMLVTPEKVN